MRILFSEQQIRERIDALAADIARELPPDFLMAPILTGAFVFAADLIRALHQRGVDPDVDFLQLSSYGGERASSGVVRLLKDFRAEIAGRPVLIVDDVLDTGVSLHFAQRMALGRGASEARLCVLIRKAVERDGDIRADYVGFDTGGEDFLAGYGMDDSERRRGAPFIGAV
jgi:hypoxanthine phosphoribosyltransferase